MAETRISRWLGLIALAAVAGILAGTLAVYFRGSFNSNNLAASACTGATAAIERVKPFAKGEVAAFQVARQPDLLTDLAFKRPDGSDITLASFAGRNVLLNLWATWCVPCRTEMPALDRLEDEVGSDKFEVVAVNVDLRNEERARAFLGEIGVKSLDFYSDPTTGVFSSLRKRGLALGLPTTVLIDGKGCRIGVLEGPAEWDSEDAKALIRAAVG